MAMSVARASANRQKRPYQKKQLDPRTIRVSKLPSNVTVSSLAQYFSNCAIPVRVYIHQDKSAGFVEFPTERDTVEAVRITTRRYPFLKIEQATKTKNQSQYNQMAPISVHPGPRNAGEERKLIQRALEIVFQKRLGEFGSCTRCRVVTTKKCANCGAFYCSKDCQLIDWNNHETICLMKSGSSELSAAPRNSVQGRQSFDKRDGRFPIAGAEAPQNLEGLRHVSYKTSHTIETSQRVAYPDSGENSRGRLRNGDDGGRRPDDFRRDRRGDDDRKPFRSFSRNFDSDKANANANGRGGNNDSSRRFSSNRSDAGSTRGGRRRDREPPKRFDKPDVGKEEEWGDSPASPTDTFPPKGKENVKPEVEDSKVEEKPPKPRSPPVEKDVEKPVKNVDKQNEILSVIGLIRESPDSYWVLTDDKLDHWQEMQIKLQDECASAPKIRPSLGLVCACFFDDMWYRAKIVSMEPKIKVHYIDFGNSSEYDAEFKKLPREIASESPMAFLLKFAKGTPSSFKTEVLDGLPFLVEVVKKTEDYVLIKIVGEDYSKASELDEEEEEVPKKKEEAPKREDRSPESRKREDRSRERPRREERSPEPPRKQERSPERFRKQERSPERFKKQERSPERFKKQERSPERPRRDERSPERPRRQERSPERPKRQERSPERPKRQERSPERPRREERSPERPRREERSPERPRRQEKTPEKDFERKSPMNLKKRSGRGNVFDSLAKDHEGAALMVSKSGSSLFGCLVPSSSDDYAVYFESLGNIVLPKHPFSANEGDSVLALHPKNYESRGVVLSKTKDSYVVSLVDYACTVTVENVYKIPDELKEFTELGVEFVIDEQMDDNFEFDPKEDMLFLFAVTGEGGDNKWPCSLKLQESESKPLKTIFKGFLKKWAPKKTLQSGSIVVICALLSFRRSYVRLADPTLEAELEKLGEKLQSQSKSAEKYRELPVVGELCAARFIDDGNYYRAVVESVNKRMADVRFIDYGNEQETKLQDLVYLSEEMKAIPPYAYEIELKGIPDTTNCSDLVKYYTRLNADSSELILTYKGNIKDGVILTEKATGVVVNDFAQEKIAATKK